MKKKLIICFCTVFTLGFVTLINAQEMYLPVPDSLVISETEEFEDDTLSVYTVEEKNYHKGSPVSLRRIACPGKSKYCDTTVTKIDYLKGKKHKERTRSVYCEQWPTDLLNDEASENVDALDNSQNEAQTLYKTKVRVYKSETVFLDSMSVTHGEYENDDVDQILNDTLVYCFDNRFFKYSSNWYNERMSASKYKDYVFDEKGKLTGFVTVFTNLTGTFTCKETIKLSEKDTLTLERNWENARHVGTTYLNEKWVYNKENQVVSFEEMNNGKVTKRISFSYYQNGDVKTKKTYYEDGRESENRYWWKQEPKRQQLWCHLESPFSFEKKGEFYHLTDTSFVDGKMKVMIYEFEMDGQASDCTPQLLESRLPLVHSEYDEKKRLIFLSTRDTESGKRKTIRYRYSNN
jgi:hypothetical protein